MPRDMEKRRAATKAWKAANPERKREHNRRWRERRRERLGLPKRRPPLPAIIRKDRERERKRAREVERSEWINKFKLDRGCEICGYNANPHALEFDHLDRATKLYEISDMVKAAWTKIRTEIAKCRVLCANCHRIEGIRLGHFKDRQSKPDPRQGYLRLGDLQ